jgi:hypothetical protein
MTTPPTHPGARPVYVVTTRGGAHLFGVHRANSKGTSTSHVLGFHDNAHAIALARGLEAYRREHGHFPPRDNGVQNMGLQSLDLAGIGEFQHVAVDALALSDLAVRLAGTGIVLSLLQAVGKEEEFTFRWTDIECNSARKETVVKRLNETMGKDAWPAPSGRARPGLAREPALLPRPVWPPPCNGGMPSPACVPDPEPDPVADLAAAVAWELVRCALRVGLGAGSRVHAVARLILALLAGP